MLTGETKENRTRGGAGAIVLVQNIARTDICALVTIIQYVVEVEGQLTENKREKVRVIEIYRTSSD